ncbi:hypothetical protein TNIN_150371 [Trichonephila inaurata madagascariensis]|uniref:Uncharacterized protein n=1 Tax=Trichonephila inaurata madagascariensis TaxID=2747483 RepID=A0A8X7BZP6_9ARAC|nr:hypothetical protein TNIN_150371 [Trichonephila inaurata madagascariensis]
MLLKKRKHYSIKDNKFGKTPILFDSTANRTVDETGSKTVYVLSAEFERTSFASVLGCAENDGRLKLMTIFKTKTMPKGYFTNNIIISVNENDGYAKNLG